MPNDQNNIEPFSHILTRYKIHLSRKQTTTLQINVGLLCNQTCGHCHLNAAPVRKETMNKETADAVISYAKRNHFDIVDITGGAPELNPHIAYLIENLSSLASQIMFRSNLSALNDNHYLSEFLKTHQVKIIASLPSLNEFQTDNQRGNGIFNKSMDTLRKLNDMEYGRQDSGLELNLVSNPTGAFLPPSQAQTEKRFRQMLEKKWGIVFNNLFSFANVPLGRFQQWLVTSGNFETYMKKLAAAFNPCAVENVMCRSLVSVSWDGYLYDCDFNLAKGMFMGGQKIHVSEMPGLPKPGSHIAVADHCYACTAGAGFT